MVSLPSRLLSQNTSRDDNPITYIIPLMILSFLFLTIVLCISLLWKYSSFSIPKKVNKHLFIHSSLPFIFQSSLPSWRRVWRTYNFSHLWWNLFTPTTSPKSILSFFLHCFHLFTKISFIFCLNSIIYEYNDQYYPNCSTYLKKQSCHHVNFYLNLGQQMCQWNSNEMKCQLNDDQNDTLRLIMIATLLGILHLIF